VFLGFVKYLEPEDVVFEVFAELLPGDFLAGLFEIGGDLAFVVRVRVAIELLVRRPTRASAPLPWRSFR